jgi:glycosyltransferase involved in cell wall biosynthesis
MHALFVHPNYPAQFGHVARYLASTGWRCTFASKTPAGFDGLVEKLAYAATGGATARTHYCSRTFENATWDAHAAYDALVKRPDLSPDLVVGHSGFGTTLFLRELYPNAKVVNYFEYFYHAHGSDLDFRPDFPPREIDRLRARARNATILLDLHYCDAGYSPTRWQHSLFPAEFRDKVRVIFDGIDTDLWKPDPPPSSVGGLAFPSGIKVVTYATRGMESLRGFDVFMKFANKLAKRRPDVVFLIAGQDRVCYGGDRRVTGEKSFKEWVLAQDKYDLSRFHFVGLLPPTELAQLFRRSDLHVYLTAPFVLSWSLLNALACGAKVLASDTPPVREVIADGVTGLLTDFFDVDAMVEKANAVLDRPADFAFLGMNGVNLVREDYSLRVCLPKLIDLFTR